MKSGWVFRIIFFINPWSFRKKEKKIQKNNVRHRLKNFIVTSKLIRRRQQRSIDSKGILKQSESEEAPNRQEVMEPISIQVTQFFY